MRNPWDPSRSAGGSSSGSAALVASGAADLALGGDQGGSVRIPSSFCGTVGQKPTYGLVPYTGAFPIENTLDHLGPITRTVRDAALLLSVLAGPDGLDPRQRRDPPGTDFLDGLDAGAAGLRVAVVQEGFGIPGVSQPGVDEVVRAAIGTLAAAGAEVTSVSVPLHRHGLEIWDVIATDGATSQMIDGNGYGLSWGGLHDPELVAHYARGRRERGARAGRHGQAGHAHRPVRARRGRRAALRDGQEPGPGPGRRLRRRAAAGRRAGHADAAGGGQADTAGSGRAVRSIWPGPAA